MRVTVYLTSEQLHLLQDQAFLAYRAPRVHLQWLIDQALQTEDSERDALCQRIKRLEQHVDVCGLASPGLTEG